MDDNTVKPKKKKMPDKKIYKEQLCIGLYIHLDLPWMKHPFFTSHFKIRTQKQLDTLRKLKMESVRFDPDKSDTKPLPLVENPDYEEPSMGENEDPLWEEKRNRIKVLKERRSKLNQTASRYEKSVESVRKLMEVLFATPEKAVHIADEVVGNMASGLTDDTEATMQLVSLKGKHESSYYHSLNVTTLSLVLGQKLGLNPEQLHTLGLGALFHDLGHQKIPTQILLKKKSLTAAEEKIYQRHTTLGVEMANKIGVLPKEVIAIIGQHHERLDGSGYPKGMTQEVGLLPRIIAVVDHYDELCNHSDPKRSLTPYEAVSMMFSKEQGKFDKTVLTTFIANLGVYPPGTLVKLSDQRIACVVTINQDELLKPNVLVYDPEIPKEEALILDLMEEELSISASCRRSDLSPAILNYLNLSEYVAYYLDQSSDAVIN
ncbi:MAG: HD-GYP domain-containing protein [Candidatus Thiodiazotropha sp.]